MVLLVALVFIIASTPLLNGSQFNNYDEFNYNRLKQMASTKGYVRVIVEIDVPGIAELTALSTNFKTGNRVGGEFFKQSAFNADLALAETISAARDNVLHHLNGIQYGLSRTFSTLPYAALTVTVAALEKLKSVPEVLRIVEDKRIPLPVSEKAAVDDDHGGLDRVHLNQSLEIVGAQAAWDLGYTGGGWYVAVIDTGIRTSHDMFQGKHIVEHCFSLGEDWYDRENGGCPNGETEMAGPGSAVHYEGRFGHGSHVAGIAAGNDGVNRFGVAKDAGIIAIQTFTYFPGENDVLAWQSDTVKGLEYVYTLRNTYNIASANMSLGGSEGYSNYCDTSLRTAAIANLRAVGIATVVSAGNEAQCSAVPDPGCVRGAITVNGTNKEDGEYRWGNWHDEMVDLMAPGTYIVSASGESDSGYMSRSGTSMSAPHVSGAWAILKQYGGNISIDNILTALHYSGTMIPSTNCPDAAPKPRIHVGDALRILIYVAPPINLTAGQYTNLSFLQTEYINQLNWESNPLNANKNVTHYRIYAAGTGGQLNQLAELDSSNFSYLHRRVNRLESVTYAITAVDDQGQESVPYYYTIEFGIEQ